MKRSILLWQVGALTFVSILGTILHFLYDWTGVGFVKFISAIDESTWEHMKILFFPMLIFSFVQYPFFKDYKNYWCVKTLGIIIGISLIPILFYTFNGAIAKSPAWVDISIFFISAGIAYLIEGVLLKNNLMNCKFKIIPVVVLVVLTVMFVAFTFNKPALLIFVPPTNS